MPNPFKPLFDQLSEAPVAMSQLTGRPFIFFRDEDAVDLAARSNLGTLGEIVAKDMKSPEQTFRMLVEIGQLDLALRFFAFAVKKRVGMWWAFNCVWEVGLDTERLAHERAMAPEAIVKTSDDPPPPAALHEIDMSKKAEEAHALSMASLKDQISAIRSSMNLPPASPPPAALADDGTTGPLRQLQMRWHAAKSALASAPMRHLNIVPTTMPPTPSARPIKPKASKALLKYQFHADAVGQDRTLRALACTLQWVLNPCQDYALQARAAAVAMQDDSPAKHLAKATFWCGENMNSKLKPTVPPPSDLPRKGMIAAVSKAMTRKGTTWSRTDRLHRFTTLAGDIATGKFTWSAQALIDFDACHQAVLARIKTAME